MPSKGVKSFQSRQEKQKLIERLTKKTHFSKLEVEKLLEVRKKLGKGKLDRAKFRDVLHNTFAITDDMILDRIFKAFDKDNETSISEEKWVSGMSVFLRGTLEERCRHCFDVYDMNSDGFISREEMYHLLKNCIVAHGNDQDDPDEGVKDLVEILIKKMDLDHDSRVSYADFSQTVLNDHLLLECLGACLPSQKMEEAFLQQIADETHSRKMYS